ncbi:MAG: ATP-binding protein [Myxococcota bacterium]
MAEGLELGVCANFAREFEAVLAGPGFEGVTARVRRSTCLGPPAAHEPPPRPAAEQVSVRCSPPRDEAPGERVEIEQCFALFASQTLVTSLQAAGAFVTSPGWVRHWEDRVAKWGFTREQARGFFGESMKEIVLLDTGIEPDAAAHCAAFGAYVGLPVRVLPVGLDYARERLRALVAEWRLRRLEAREREAQRRAAELSMALELLRALPANATEAEVMASFRELCAMVFAPRQLAWRAVVADAWGPILPADAPAAAVEALRAGPARSGPLGDDALVLALTVHGAPVAAVWAGGLEFPARRAEYLELIGSTTELFGLELLAARERASQRRTELELRQAKKLESVGRLASGIAHEINTPAQFVGDSVAFARDATQALTTLIGAALEVCTRLEAGQPTTEQVARVRALEREVDLPFVRENLPRALGHAEQGLERIASIVRAMREFAHPGVDKAAVDLNRALEATAEVARHEYKYVADLEWQLAPTLPPVWGVAAELNQVFVNVLVNAAHAIEDAVGDSGRRGRITLRTYVEGDFVVAAISDTGCGIPPEAREHLFEQFFTTKEVGRGTGQGLSIAWRIIVDRHGGQLTFETTEGQGTTFFIKVPRLREGEEQPAEP